MKKLVVLLLILGCNHNEKQPQERLISVMANIPPLQIQVNVKTEVNTCDEGMIHVKGNYCLSVQQSCKIWLDPVSVKARYRRCLTYNDALCTSQYTEMNFCIDQYEYSDESNLPLTNINWKESKSICESIGKRLCSDEEWTFACEGEKILAHPYGNTRDHNACYHDKTLSQMLDSSGSMLDLRHSIDTHPGCVSPFGVRNMVGNVGEWTHYSKVLEPYRSGGKGGWWNSGLRSRCRPITVGHDESFKQVQIGFRCCDEVND